MSSHRKFKIGRRAFLYGAAGITLEFNPLVGRAWSAMRGGGAELRADAQDNCLFVSNGGSDSNPGTESHPLQSFHAAQMAVAKLKQSAPGSISVFFRAGTYYLPEPVVFGPGDSGEPEAPIVYSAYPGESVILSGGNCIAPVWTPYPR